MPTERSYTELELMQARVEFVPDGWRFCGIREAFVIRNNLRRPISEEERAKNSGPYPYFGPTKIQGYIGTYEQDGKYALIGEDGDHFLKYRTQPMTQLVEGKCTVNNHAHIIEGSDIASREWFYHYFMHRDIFSFLSRQGAGRYKLNKASLEKIPVLIPPRPEQKKIAQILSTWDQAITATERLLEKSQQRKKGLMQQLLTGKKRLPGFEGRWEAKHISQTGKIVSGGTPDTNDGDLWGGDVQWLTPTDITALKTHFIYDTPRKITEKGVKESSATLMPSGSLCVCTRASVGLMAISTTPITTNQGFKSVIPNNKHDVEFLYYLFSFNRQVFIRYSSGSTFMELSKKDFVKIIFNYPPVAEQKAIARILASANNEIEQLQKRINRLKQEKKALMQQLLTGKRRVNVDMEAA